MGGKNSGIGTKPTEVEGAYRGAFLDDLDGRMRVARTLRERWGALTTDLGGVDDLSYQERSLCKRAVYLERLLEKKESTLAHGGDCDEAIYLNGINALSALYSKLGLKRRAKQLPSLHEYVNGKPAQPTNTNAPTKSSTPHAKAGGTNTTNVTHEGDALTPGESVEK